MPAQHSQGESAGLLNAELLGRLVRRREELPFGARGRFDQPFQRLAWREQGGPAARSARGRRLFALLLSGASCHPEPSPAELAAKPSHLVTAHLNAAARGVAHRLGAVAHGASARHAGQPTAAVRLAIAAARDGAGAAIVRASPTMHEADSRTGDWRWSLRQRLGRPLEPTDSSRRTLEKLIPRAGGDCPQMIERGRY